MHATLNERIRALRRSRVQVGILQLLLATKVAHPQQIATAIGSTPRNVRWAIRGHHPQYRPDRALLELGLVRTIRLPRGVAYALTKDGESLARRLGPFHATPDVRRSPRRLR